MPKRKDVAPCGIYCAGCVVYKASDDPELAKKISENMSVSVEDAQCKGCIMEEGEIGVLPIEGKCPTYTCVEENEIDYCFECEDYPCARLHTYKNSPLPHNSKINNLTLMDKKGLDWFLENVEELTKMYYHGNKEHGGSKLRISDSK